MAAFAPPVAGQTSQQIAASANYQVPLLAASH